MPIISLDKVLRTMAETDGAGNFKPFQIKVVKFSLHRNTGGTHLEYKQAVLCSKADRSGEFNIKGLGTDQPRAINPLLIIEFNGQEVSI